MSRALWRRLVSARARHTLHTQARNLRERGLGEFVQWQRLLLDAALRERLQRKRYHYVDGAALAGGRRSDTVFVFGSGYSLNAITPEEWRRIAEHDTFGFTAFVYQQWVRVDYHLLRGGVEGSLRWRAYAEEFCAALNANPRFAETMFLMQGDYEAQFCNQVLGYGLLRPDARVYRYRTARGDGPPTRDLGEGLRHVGGTLSDAVNAAACLGWRRIVLAGVDLYDSRYFWLPPDKTYEFDAATGLLRAGDVNPRGLGAGERHNTARNGVVRVMGEWRAHLAARGIELVVYNPRSLLADVMPVYAAS